MAGVFITGTDTGIGKTTVAAGILKLLQGSRPIGYWKPVQTGTVVGDDTKDIVEMTGLTKEEVFEPGYRFADPVAPYLAAKQWKQEIDFKKLVTLGKEYSKKKFLVVEGAGGILVPLTKDHLLIDLMDELKLPVLVVSENKLGTINQCLLTVDALRKRKIDLLGIVLTRASNQDKGNAECIEHFGKVKVLADFEKREDRKAVVAQVSCDDGLRALFKVPEIPS